jgi:hypothetical protein
MPGWRYTVTAGWYTVVMVGEGRPSTSFLCARGRIRGWPAFADHDDWLEAMT